MWDQDLDVDMFYKYSLTWLEVSDIMFLVPGWGKSKGTLKEIEVAKGLGIKIVTELGELNGIHRISK